MDIDTNDPFQKEAKHTAGWNKLSATLEPVSHWSMFNIKDTHSNNNPKSWWQVSQETKVRDAHDVVAFRRGLARAERPGEFEDAACAD